MNDLFHRVQFVSLVNNVEQRQLAKKFLNHANVSKSQVFLASALCGSGGSVEKTYSISWRMA